MNLVYQVYFILKKLSVLIQSDREYVSDSSIPAILFVEFLHDIVSLLDCSFDLVLSGLLVLELFDVVPIEFKAIIVELFPILPEVLLKQSEVDSPRSTGPCYLGPYNFLLLSRLTVFDKDFVFRANHKIFLNPLFLGSFVSVENGQGKSALRMRGSSRVTHINFIKVKISNGYVPSVHRFSI